MTEEPGYDLEAEAGVSNENDDPIAESAATFAEASRNLADANALMTQQMEAELRQIALRHAIERSGRPDGLPISPEDVVKEAETFLAFLKGGE